VHVPARFRCTVVPLTEQLPLAANNTVKPEDAVACTVKSGAPKVLSGSAAKVIVWLAFPIAND